MHGILPFIGWAALAICMSVFASIVGALAWTTAVHTTSDGKKPGLPEYGIALAAVLVAGFGWHWLFSIAPFQIIVK